MFDVITIGAATRDVYLKSPAFDLIKSDQFSTGVGECLALGSKNEASEIFLDTGGGATNAAATFGNLKLKVAVISRVGNDSAGRDVLDVLKEKNADVSLMQKDKKHLTTYSTLLLTGAGHRSVLVYRGASNFIEWNGIPKNKLKTKWFYITSLGGNIKLLNEIFKFAKKNKIKIAWNPGGKEIKSGLKKLLPYIKQAEVLNVNREEASALLNIDYDKKDEILKKMKNIGAKIVVVTDGPDGAYLYGEKWFFASSLGTKPKNTTGAGDAFGSGLVAGLIIKNDIDYALRLATLNADGVIKKMGAKNGLLEYRPAEKDLKKVRIREV
jgi:sugar/nucleoside kinase (ribokinase family)